MQVLCLPHMSLVNPQLLDMYHQVLCFTHHMSLVHPQLLDHQARHLPHMGLVPLLLLDIQQVLCLPLRLLSPPPRLVPVPKGLVLPQLLLQTKCLVITSQVTLAEKTIPEQT